MLSFILPSNDIYQTFPRIWKGFLENDRLSVLSRHLVPVRRFPSPSVSEVASHAGVFMGVRFSSHPSGGIKKRLRGRLYPRSIDNRGIKWVIKAGHSLLHSRFRAFLVRRSVACSRLYYSIPTRGRESEERKPITVLETQSDYWVCILRQVSFKYYWILY